MSEFPVGGEKHTYEPVRDPACPDPLVFPAGSPAREPLVARRRRMRAAVLDQPNPVQGQAIAIGGPSRAEARPGGVVPLRSRVGVVLDASPHLLVMAAADAPAGHELRIPLTEDTTVWSGSEHGNTALRPGRDVVVAPQPDGHVAKRIWVGITRLAGVITTAHRGRGNQPDEFEVDAGPHRGRFTLIVAAQNRGAVMVRHPVLEPGHLIDVIGVHSSHPRVVFGLAPATSQPDHDGMHPSARSDRPRGARVHQIQGTVTWFDESLGPVRASGTDPLRGLAYPALDPEESGCRPVTQPYAFMPYLSTGSELSVRNDCTGHAVVMPIVECGCQAGVFDDRCAHCGLSPRGRIAELTRASFVDLGGALEAGCFPGTVTVG